MADSNQLRSERRRRHARGDHSMCQVARCPARAEQARAAMRVVPDLAAVAEDDEQPGQFGPAVQAALDALGQMAFAEDDPRFLIAVTVIRMAEAFDTAPTAGLAGEIRRQVSWLLEQGLSDADRVDEIRAKVAQKHAKLLIEHAFSKVPASG